ncbi:MAG: C_GCAxxG_C_C family protein [Spirochaetes bacterium]|nr:C_GCAxxG_C_C family protein [Spirochaetota bacterium]
MINCTKGTMNTTIERKEDISERVQNALEHYDQGYSCSQSIVLAFSDLFDLDHKHATLISSGFGGGMGRLRRTCGALTGAYMILGLKFGNHSPDDNDSKLDGYRAVRKLTEQFEAIHSTSVCKELLANHSQNQNDPAKRHHKHICRKAIEDTARILESLITE